MSNEMLNIGTVINGTMIPKDIASAILSLGVIQDSEASAAEDKFHDLELVADENCGGGDEYEILHEVFEWLSLHHCPPYTYFGSHEADGSDIGCWPDFDMIDNDRRDGDIADFDSLPHDGQTVIEVNDHGNVSVYRVRVTLEPIWDCV